MPTYDATFDCVRVQGTQSNRITKEGVCGMVKKTVTASTGNKCVEKAADSSTNNRKKSSIIFLFISRFSTLWHLIARLWVQRALTHNRNRELSATSNENKRVDILFHYNVADGRDGWKWRQRRWRRKIRKRVHIDMCTCSAHVYTLYSIIAWNTFIFSRYQAANQHQCAQERTRELCCHHFSRILDTGHRTPKISQWQTTMSASLHFALYMLTLWCCRSPSALTIRTVTSRTIVLYW